MKLKKPYTIPGIQKRLLTFIMLITFIFCALCGRLAYVQLAQGRELQSKAMDQWMRELPVTPARGKITDVNGKLLVSDYTTYSVYVRPRAVKNAAAAASLLSQTVGVDKTKIFDKINKGGVSEITVAKQVEKPQADALKLAGLDGIYLSEDAKRNYIYGDFLTQVLGYTNIDGAGQARILVSIVSPLLMPAIAALALLVFIDYWNVVDQAIVFIRDPNFEPLSVALSRFRDNYEIVFAASFFYMVPALLVFLYGQDQLVEGMKMSGLK